MSDSQFVPQLVDLPEDWSEARKELITRIRQIIDLLNDIEQRM